MIDKRRTEIQYQHGECHRVGIIAERPDQVNHDTNQGSKINLPLLDTAELTGSVMMKKAANIVAPLNR